MKVTYRWLKDFVKIKLAPKALAEKLTMAGLEVTSLEEKEGDVVFEIEVTANRPDCLSVAGVAREVAAITNSKLQAPGSELKPETPKGVYPLKIKIEHKKDCPLYTAKIIKDVKVGPAPDWLRRRLELIGCHSVNNIVDITNYILFELGEPLHAFDLDKLNPGTIMVRRAKPGEKITTIDGEQKILNPDILVIADEKKPVAIAGIMGGKDTEVTESTKNILLEAAVFNPVMVRRGRQNLGLQSESAYRFERGASLEIVDAASWRVTQLIQELAGGRCVLAKSSGLPKTKKRRINLEVPTVQKILGVNIVASKIKKILKSLGFQVKTKNKNNLTVEIPGQRADVNLEIDLIEEIARIFGYAFIPQSLPAVKPQAKVGDLRDLVTLVKNILVGLGLNEAITYGLIDQELWSSFGAQGGLPAIEILNPLSKEQEILRPRLIPSLAACIAYNLNQKQDYINIFEVAKAFSGSVADPKEELFLGIALCGVKAYLLEPGLIKEEVGFLHLKGILEVLFERLGIKDYDFNPQDSPSAIAIFVRQEKIGALVRLEKSTLDAIEIKNKDVFALELSLEKVFAYAQLKKKFLSPPKYPGIARDISFILKEDIALKEILEAIRERGGVLLRNIKIVDFYKGKQIPAGYQGLTISCLYRADERTLTEAEINPLHNLVYSILTERFGAKIR